MAGLKPGPPHITWPLFQVHSGGLGSATLLYDPSSQHLDKGSCHWEAMVCHPEYKGKESLFLSRCQGRIRMRVVDIFFFIFSPVEWCG